MWPKDEDEGTNVSNENNFSAYSGLRMLEFVLANNTDGADAVLTKAKQDVDKLIEGLEKWFNADGLFSDKSFGGNQVPTTGMYPEAANDGQEVKIVTQGGHVTFGGEYTPVGILEYSGFAVDCQTWGMSVMVPYLGLDWLEGKLGGTNGAYNLWQQVKLRAGHYKNGTIAGVAFTQDLNFTCLNVTKPPPKVGRPPSRIGKVALFVSHTTVVRIGKFVLLCFSHDSRSAGQPDLHPIPHLVRGVELRRHDCLQGPGRRIREEGLRAYRDQAPR